MQFDWTFPWLLLIGHWLGDYILQFHEMAIKKTSSNMWCTYHSLVYTLCIISVLGFVWNFIYINPLSWLIIFLTHYPIDRYSIGYKIMKLKGGPDFTNPFAPIIYVLIDNGLHLILMAIFIGWLI